MNETSDNDSSTNMRVIKRNGKSEIMMFDKILKRVKNLGKQAGIHSINYTSLAMKVIEQLYDNIPTSKIDTLTAEHCASMSSTHYEYDTLASRVIISNYHKNTIPSFYETVKILYENNKTSQLTDEFYENVETNKDFYERIIDYDRDFLLDYFGFKTLEKSYLMKVNGKAIERPQHLWMRVAIAIHMNDLEMVEKTYYYISNKYFIHATPTLFNAGTKTPQLSSCFLMAMKSDSLDGIYDTLHDCAKISKYAGGIGLHIHNIRGNGSIIRSTNSPSSGIVPMLRVFNNTARYINQGGKRNGSIAIYLEPWHCDIEGFLDTKTNLGDEEIKARDLFYALWIPDLFMEKINKDEEWCLFCPDECKNLSEVYGEEFNKLYFTYEKEEKFKRKIKARDLWLKILDTQMETGTPYILFKDACNKKSNQQNLGTIKSSNLCCEIVEDSDDKETAVCNLASICLPMFVNKETKEFDYEKLHDVVKLITTNLNNVIDINFYPIESARYSNMKNRPIGIGVQGLSNVFFMMDLPFESEQSKKINKNIFETIYHASLERSNELAIQHGVYSSFYGSPTSRGLLQFDLWGVQQSNDRYDWTDLKERIVKDGLRNSLLVAPMPTASTSQIMGFNECFEPITSNIYVRGTMAGEFIVVNKYLVKELISLGLWNTKIKNSIIEYNGSIQHMKFLSQHIRDKYKNVWEMSMKNIIDMASDRGIYICQSQSMNLWVEEPNYKILNSMYFYAYKKGLKTGIYYLRRKPKAFAQKFTIEPEQNKNEEEICEMCSS